MANKQMPHAEVAPFKPDTPLAYNGGLRYFLGDLVFNPLWG